MLAKVSFPVGVVVYAYNSSTWTAETEGLPTVQDQPEIPNKTSNTGHHFPC